MHMNVMISGRHIIPNKHRKQEKRRDQHLGDADLASDSTEQKRNGNPRANA